MRLMGFGHRVYRVEDPRAKHLRRLATELGKQVGDESKVQISTRSRASSPRRSTSIPNVDLFSGAGYAAWASPPTSSRRSSR
jgi:citrate synthase